MALAVPEFPPILVPGLHPQTLATLRVLSCDNFPLSKTRGYIMSGIEDVAHRLNNDKVIGDLWVDGSFMTTKVDPADADLVLRIQSSFFDKATSRQRAVINWVQSNLKGSHGCDSYMFTEWPPNHPNYWVGEYMRAYWLRQYGFSRGQAMKGIVVIELRGSAL